MLTGPRIKIAQVITRLDRGGSPDIFRILCSHLDPDIYDLTIVTGPTENPTARTLEFLNRFRAKTVLVPDLKRDIEPRSDLAALWDLYRLFRRERFSIVHTHTAKAGALGRIAAKLAGGSVVVHTPHGHNFYGYFGPAASSRIVGIERFLARITDQIVALTQLERSDYIKYGVADPGKVTVICQGLELRAIVQDFKERSRLRALLGIPARSSVVGMVGRLEPVKGSLFFVEASAGIAKACGDAFFLVVGDGSLRADMEKRALELGLSGRIKFAGWRDDASDMMAAMDLLVLPSLNEAVGMVLIEAQAHGVPVVATRVGGVPEVVSDGRTGLLVEPSDPSAIAASAIALLSDPKRREAMGEAGVSWVFDKFRAEDMAFKTSAMYVELLNKKKMFGR
jgi:glycosyltransferase involved in cell wall biosynthesis